jgi:hypothetical protein
MTNALEWSDWYICVIFAQVQAKAQYNKANSTLATFGPSM